MFGEIKTTDWVSKLKLSEKREDDIRECFEGTEVEFHYPEDNSDFNLLTENFERENIVNDDGLDENILGEKKNLTGLL